MSKEKIVFETIDQNPSLSVKDIVLIIKEKHNVSVSENYVYNLKSKNKPIDKNIKKQSIEFLTLEKSDLIKLFSLAEGINQSTTEEYMKLKKESDRLMNALKGASKEEKKEISKKILEISQEIKKVDIIK